MSTTYMEGQNPSLLGAGSAAAGVSEDAQAIRERFADAVEELLATVSGGSAYRAALGSLQDAIAEAMEADWDGYGAQPADIHSVLMAERLLRFLPRKLPPPDVSIEPDGEVAFEWHVEPRRALSVSVSGQGELAYAGLFGGARTHGTEFFEDELPEAIRWNLHRLYTSPRR